MNKEKKHNEVEKINLTLPSNFYEIIKTKADKEYVKVTTWVRQFLMKTILTNKDETKNQNNHEK